MAIDPRSIAGLQLQLDALGDEAEKTGDRELREALNIARIALARTHKILAERSLHPRLSEDLFMLPDFDVSSLPESPQGRTLHFQVPDDYEPPEEQGRTLRLQVPDDYEPPEGGSKEGPPDSKIR